MTLLVRGDSLSKSMSDYLIGELRRTPNVFVRLGVDLVDGEGEEQLETIVVRDRARGELECIPSDGLFVMIGAEPRTDWLGDAVARDERGFILTGADLPADAMAARSRAAAVRDEPARRLRRRRRPPRLREARHDRDGRGRNRDPARPPVPRHRPELAQS